MNKNINCQCSICHRGNNSRLATEFLKELIEKTGLDEQCVRYAGSLSGEIGIGNYRPDFKFGKKIIEIFGDYYHLHPTHPANSNISGRSRTEQNAYDKARITFIEGQGFETFIIWECEILKNREGALRSAAKFLEISLAS